MIMECGSEVEGKRVHDPLFYQYHGAASNSYCMTMRPAVTAKTESCVWAPGPIIVGAGPSGLAVAACLKEKGVSSLILERDERIASLWQFKTYDRLRLHLPKKFCQLPLMPFPDWFPTYPTRQQFIDYLDNYAKRFDIRPAFNKTVVSAEYDAVLGFWRVRTAATNNSNKERTEYVSRCLVVATGENAEAVLPEIVGVREYKGTITHTSAYTTGDIFQGKRVLVVGCGNSGMEVCLDLCNHNAYPSIVVRDKVHVLPREMLGSSTFGLSMWLLKWLPVRMVDRLLLFVAGLMFGDTARFGLERPQIGPLELKLLSGKTPILDVGTLAKIKSGDIKVCPAVKRFTEHGVEFVDGRSSEFDDVILATGYKSNVPSWLKEREFFSEKDGLPRRPFPNGWKGDRGLYAAGFTKRGILGASMDAMRIANDIEQCWKAEDKRLKAFHRPSEQK